MEVGEVPKGIRWSAKAGGPPKVIIGGVSSRGRGPTIKGAFYCLAALELELKLSFQPLVQPQPALQNYFEMPRLDEL